jgi:hypothetical protein
VATVANARASKTAAHGEHDSRWLQPVAEGSASTFESVGELAAVHPGRVAQPLLAQHPWQAEVVKETAVSEPCDGRILASTLPSAGIAS